LRADRFHVATCFFYTEVNFLPIYFCVIAYIEVFFSTLNSGCRLRCLSCVHNLSMYSGNLYTSVSILIRQHAGQPWNRISVPSRDKDFIFSSSSKRNVGLIQHIVQCAPRDISLEVKWSDVKLVSLVPRLRRCEARPHSPIRLHVMVLSYVK
jgi:hypothetical protein